MAKIAINGFGRIGKLAFRNIIYNYPNVEIGAVNTSGSVNIEGLAHFLKYDTVYGRFGKAVKINKPSGQEGELGSLEIEGKVYPFLGIREPEKIPWSKYEVETIIEATGVFKDQEKAGKHFSGGANKVIISAPPKDDMPIFILGVNNNKYQGQTICSNGSCTTNCAAPVIKTIMDVFGIKNVVMTTIHSYTSTQNLVDGSHKDLRRARAAAQNIIPTTTGAAKAVIAAIPELKGKFSASAIRVPTATGSFSDFTFILEKETTKEEVNDLFIQKSQNEMKNILFATYDEIVSTDIVGTPFSAIVDLSLTEVVNGNLLKVYAWYDNEWAYTCRLIEMASLVSSK